MLAAAGFSVAVVSACTSGHGGKPTEASSPASAAFGGSAAKISVTSGQTGKDWWTWATSASISADQTAAIQASQRYLVLDFWLKNLNAAVDKVNPAPIIATVATGNAAQQLTSYANVASGLTAGPILGGNSWGFVASQAAKETSSTVVVCTVIGDAKAGGAAKPSAAILADAVTKNGPGAWTFHVFNVDGAWRVGAVANPSPHLPASCQGWYAGLRTQAGLPAK